MNQNNLKQLVVINNRALETGSANPPDSADSSVAEAFTLSLKHAAEQNKII